MVRIRQLLTALTLLLLAQLAQAELMVEVTQGVEAPTPVAVVPFGNETGSALAEDLARVVDQDLERSGFFATMARENMLSFPTKREDLYFRDWRVSNMDYVVIGRIESSPAGQLSVGFELYDVLREQRLLAEQVSATASSLRDAAHYIADRVFEQLTGLKGAFATKIVYVTAERLGDGKQRYRLQLADWDGARAQTILESSQPIMSPAWSMDGSKLAYVSFETGRPAIYVQYLASGKRERIQSFPGLNGAPAWSPDGNRLGYRGSPAIR